MQRDLRDELLALEAGGAVVHVQVTTPGVGAVAPSGDLPQPGGPFCRIEHGGVVVAGLGRTVDEAVEDALARWETKASEVRGPNWTLVSGPEVVSKAGDDFLSYRWTLGRNGHQDVTVDVEISRTLIAAPVEQWPGAASAIQSRGRSEAEAVAWWRWPPNKSRYLSPKARDFSPYGQLERVGGEP
jgi:hypothetical protein